MLERISDAVADTAPAVREMMNDLAGFKDTGKRMLATWNDGVNHLRDSRMYGGPGPWKSSEAFEGNLRPTEAGELTNGGWTLGTSRTTPQREVLAVPLHKANSTLPSPR